MLSACPEMEEVNTIEDNSTIATSLSHKEGNANLESSAQSVTDQQDDLDRQPQRVEKGPKIRRFLEKFGSTSSINFEEVQSPKLTSPKEHSPTAKKSENASITDNAKINSGHKRSNTVPVVIYQSKTENVDSIKNSKKVDTSKGHIDTTAPFESVRQAVNKFGGIVGKVQQTLTLEKQKGIQLELRKVQDEVVKHRKQSESAMAKKAETLKELENGKQLAEDLKLSLEKAKTQEAHAKQDLVLAELRVQEISNGIGVEESTSIKRQLEVAHERHANAVAELSFIKKELENLKQEHATIIQELDIKMGKTEVSADASKEIENTIENLTMELVTAKFMLESSQNALINAEESRNVTEMALEEEKLNLEKELEPVQNELELLNQQLQLSNDLRLKLDAATNLLLNVRSELTSYVEAKLNEEGEEITNVDETELNPWQLLCRTRKELKDTRNHIEHAKDEVNCLGTEVSSLTSEMEKEKESLATMREKYTITSLSMSSLEDELSMTYAELELIQTREREAREKIEELPKQIEMATQEVDRAKSAANSARDELKRIREEVEFALARVNAVESRTNATILEIEAAKASAEFASSAWKALEESEHETVDSPKVVTLSPEEYDKLSKSALEAEELFDKRVNSVLEQIKVVKESESLSLGKLEEVNRMIQEKKESLKAATEKAQKAEEDKLAMEEELQKLRTEHDMQTKAADEIQNLADNSQKIEPKNFASDDEDTASESSFVTSPDTVLVPANEKIPETVAPKKKYSIFYCGVTFSKKKSVKH